MPILNRNTRERREEVQDRVSAMHRSGAHLDEVRGAVRASAREDHVGLAQYDGKWEGDEWFVVRSCRNLTTRMGQAVKLGDVTIAKPGTVCGGNPREWLTIYSIRNCMNTALPRDAFEEVS